MEANHTIRWIIETLTRSGGCSIFGRFVLFYAMVRDRAKIRDYPNIDVKCSHSVFKRLGEIIMRHRFVRRSDEDSLEICEPTDPDNIIRIKRWNDYPVHVVSTVYALVIATPNGVDLNPAVLPVTVDPAEAVPTVFDVLQSVYQRRCSIHSYTMNQGTVTPVSLARYQELKQWGFATVDVVYENLLVFENSAADESAGDADTFCVFCKGVHVVETPRAMLRHCGFDRRNECQQTKWRRFCLACVPMCLEKCPGCFECAVDQITLADILMWTGVNSAAAL